MDRDASLLARLRGQLADLPFVLAGASEEKLKRRPPSGKWSAHEHLAHLARYHEVFRERLERIRNEDRPRFARYRAEEDSGWPGWPERDGDELRRRLQESRGDLVALFERLPAAELRRIGIHPVFGEMSVPEWTQFFLLHEAQHLYVILGLARV